MPSIQLDDSPWGGRTSPPPWRRPYDPLDCKRCGSSLIGRREEVRCRTTRGVAVVVEVFRCRCGRGRRIQRQQVPA